MNKAFVNGDSSGSNSGFGPKILAYGFPLDSNFGGPSVVHGFRAALKELFPGHELVVYQQRKVDPVSVADMDFPVREFPYRRRMFEFYRDWLLLKLFGRRSANSACARFWDDYRAADAVVNIYPICFCAKLKTHLTVKSRRGAVAALFREFGPNLLARLDGKASVKSTASYGPFRGRGNALLARLSARWAFTRAAVREKECMQELQASVGRRCRLLLAPDLANLWRPDAGPVREDVLGVSVSYQSEVQWHTDDEDYVTFLQALIRHARNTYGCKVILIPNQFRAGSKRSDDVLAEKVLAGFGGDAGVELFDAAHATPSALRRTIGGCAAMITCRYHSCVAGFAAGVPQLVLGWHCKYRELATRYGQERWVVQTDGLHSTSAKQLLDELWQTRASVRAELAARSDSVRRAVVLSVEWLFADLLPKVSVVLPVYNVADYLSHALESISAQTLRGLEIIAVDDGSTDGSGAILDNYAKMEPRMKVIHIPNGGAGAARNVGLEQARGEYLFFCDPDDWCGPKLLRRLYDRAAKTDADVVVTGKTVVDAETGVVMKRSLPPTEWSHRSEPFDPAAIADRLFKCSWSSPWNKLFRRAFAVESGIRFQNTPRSNDAFFVYTSLARAQRVSYLAASDYRYRSSRPGCLSLSKDKYPTASFDAYAAIEGSLRENGLWPTFRRGFLRVYLPWMVKNLRQFRLEESWRMCYPRIREHFLALREEESGTFSGIVPKQVIESVDLVCREPDVLLAKEKLTAKRREGMSGHGAAEVR